MSRERRPGRDGLGKKREGLEEWRKRRRGGTTKKNDADPERRDGPRGSRKEDGDKGNTLRGKRATKENPRRTRRGRREAGGWRGTEEESGARGARRTTRDGAPRVFSVVLGRDGTRGACGHKRGTGLPEPSVASNFFTRTNKTDTKCLRSEAPRIP